MSAPLPPSAAVAATDHDAGRGFDAAGGEGSASRPVRVPKTAEVVAQNLRRQIVRGQLRAGESLPAETALTEVYGVSRPTLREAFRILETEQLITIRRGARGGATVHAPTSATVARHAAVVLEHDGTTLADVCEARVLVEGPCAGLAAKRRTDADVERLRRLIAACELVGHDHLRMAVESSEFHLALVEIADNATMLLMHRMLRRIIDMAKVRRLDHDDELAARSKAMSFGTSAHAHIVDLIESGDATEAEAFWIRHLTASNRFLLEAHPDLALAVFD